MQTWRLLLEYEGTRYHGWQEQRNFRTVAGELRAAAEKGLGHGVDIAGAGRTDAGVHAAGQVARLRSRKRARPGELIRLLNDNLPADINVLAAAEAQASFDPRREATMRYYVYQISTRRSAFAKRFVWWVRDGLDLDRMARAAESLKGRHDFRNFCEAGDDDKSTVVNVESAELGRSGDLILFRIGAPRFLWKMVRRVLGSLVEVGRGSLSVEQFGSLIQAGPGVPAPKGFSVAARTAPPSGLFLERVVYGEKDRPRDLMPIIPVSGTP
ncbi:MAG TPA: tRNA pseudouridine(38-40) synthase TruA [Blastocatellia bacterium]|nr:tRNA pseudouridine(38-40) synthase TruA [Blastocatellia bacterium]